MTSVDMERSFMSSLRQDSCSTCSSNVVRLAKRRVDFFCCKLEQGPGKSAGLAQLRVNSGKISSMDKPWRQRLRPWT